MAHRPWVIIGGGLTAVGLGWSVLQVTLLSPNDRSNASTYGQFVLAAVGTLLMLWQIVGNGHSARRDVMQNLDELTDKLAAVVGSQWTAAAAERGLHQPAPLPIRWRRCPEPVTGPLSAATTPRPAGVSFDPLPGIGRVTPGQLRKGTHRTLHRIYGGLTSGRLIITGGPGTGKSSAAILLLLDALRYRNQTPPDRRARVPVPVLFTLHGWDPATTAVNDWLTTKLTELPLLNGRHGRHYAAKLLAAGRIAVFLDGLDEIPEVTRLTAVQALTQQATFRLVLLTRTSELVTAAQHHILTGAAAVELDALAPADAATYLHHGLTDPAPPSWQKLITTLQDDSDTPVARALTSPLTITLLRDIYPPIPAPNTTVGSVDELLDTSCFPRPDDITHHLLDHAITAAYTAPQYTPETAHRTLTVIAQYLRDRNTRDIAWWTTLTWVPRIHRMFLGALLGAVPVGLLTGISFGLVVELAEGSGFIPIFVLMLGLGLLAGGLATVTGGITPRPARPIKWRQIQWRPTANSGLLAGLMFGSVCGLMFGSHIRTQDRAPSRARYRTCWRAHDQSESRARYIRWSRDGSADRSQARRNHHHARLRIPRRAHPCAPRRPHELACDRVHNRRDTYGNGPKHGSLDGRRQPLLFPLQTPHTPTAQPLP
jgi:hypothetical protein